MFNNPYQIPNTIGDIVWVTSKEEIKNIQVAPNKQKVFFLRDADKAIFYVLSSNEIGMTTLATYNFSEVIETKPEDKFVTKEEFKKLLDALGGTKNVESVNE